MEKRIYKIVLVLFVFQVSVAEAASSGRGGIFFATIEATGGYGSINAPNDTASTSAGFTTIEALYGFRIAQKFLVGAITGYSFITQFSAVDQAVGNRRGGYLNLVAPMIGVSLPSIFFHAAYHLSGTYDLTNKTFSGQVISYSNPSGFRLEFGLNWAKKFKPLLFFEQISFGKKLVGGVDTTGNLPIKTQQYGLGLAMML